GHWLRRLGSCRDRLGDLRWLDHRRGLDLELCALDSFGCGFGHGLHLPLVVGERPLELAHLLPGVLGLLFGATVHGLAERAGSLGTAGDELRKLPAKPEELDA